MNQRPALYALAAHYRLDAAATRQLYQMAGLDQEPTGVARRLPLGVAAAAAALIGLGLILWVAANWDSLGRVGQFALLQGVVLTLCLGALALPGARPALGLLALLAIGGLFAYFGQTYQTGADPWQLFALWAGLTLPLCLGVRQDLLWTPWALVAMTGVTLWVQAHTDGFWRVAPTDLAVHAWAWGAAAVLVVGLSPAARRLTGAGVWALRTALTLAVTLVTLSALGGLFSSAVAPHYGLGVLVLALAGLVLALPRTFEVAALSAVALGLDALLLAGLGHWLLVGHGGDDLDRLLLLGLAGTALLAGNVTGILALARRYGAGGQV